MAGTPNRPVRIALIAVVIDRHDAVSAAVIDHYRALSAVPGWEVSLLAAHTDFDDLAIRIVPGVAQLVLDPVFQAADILIYHFAMHNSLWDALLVGNGRARQVVCFHNITPAELMPARQRRLVCESERQLSNLRHADRLWPVSQVNADRLCEAGMAPGRITVMPLAVDRPAAARLQDKPQSPVELLFVGRFVASKGILDLLDAVGRIGRDGVAPFHLTLVGNLAFSDRAYAERVAETIADRCEGDRVTLEGTADDDRLQTLYHRAQIFAIPSYHEGFCKPVIEALRAGCLPVGYAAYNLKYITGGLGRMVPPGDIAGLAAALAELIAAAASPALAAGGACLPLDAGLLSADDFQARADAHVDQFRFDRIATRCVAAVRDLLAS
ncbi:glycosyltransferase family 4 protein [Telmatospirillum sp.]|uniref:glycosyltransferase family 4 protein n=1 Tax=Telmatospirillum sp. TaxID=2079197 RepID=UPI00284C38CE|nr:glycosyltransferase family 4 protein [Telmatospirillum sp.]MDR3435677.1 glycosyltransferase family 4 protein [Telmatospirillum sp.]